MKKFSFASLLTLVLIFSGIGFAPTAHAVTCDDPSVVCPTGQYCDLNDFICKAVPNGGGGDGEGGGLNVNALTPYTDDIINLINHVLFPLLFSVAFITFLYGVSKKYIFSRGDETAVEEGHKLILWGVIGFVVMISLWGIVNVVNNTLGLSEDNQLNPQNLPHTPLRPGAPTP